MGKGAGENKQIKKTGTFEIGTEKKIEDLFDVPRSKTVKDIGADGAEIGQEQKEKAPATIEDLKDKAKDIPVVIPMKKAKAKTGLQQAKDTMHDLHVELEAEEEQTLTDEERRNIRRKKYASLSASDIEKRAKNALKRRMCAQGIMKYDSKNAGKEIEYTHVGKKTFLKKLELFKKYDITPAPMETDEDFVRNLSANLRKCEIGAHMKFWIDEAVESGYMPADENMELLQKKIAMLDEMKQYIDVQKNIMKNPYYQYMAKEDVNYSDVHLESFINKLNQKTKNRNEVLLSYLRDIRTLRSLKFVRSKGMKSVEQRAKERAKKASEILATRSEKRELVNTLSDKIMTLEDNKRLSDKSYDARFSPELFKDTLEKFKALKLSDIHYSGVKDIITHYDENRYLFNQMHDFEHLLFMAVQRGLAPDDNELIELRAKMETIMVTERVVTNIYTRVMTAPDRFINEMTYDEMAEECFERVKKQQDGTGRQVSPKPGENLTEYFKSLHKSYKKDHKDRKKTIRLAYGLSHPTHIESDEGDDQLAPGEISDAELEKRAAGYQKNVVLMDYMRNIEVYLQSVAFAQVTCVSAVHARKTGRPMFQKADRTLPPYMAGKSAKEMTRIIDIMQTGTDEDREKLWKDIAQDCFNVNMADMSTSDPKLFYKNLSYKARMYKIFANLGGSGSRCSDYIKDKEFLKLTEAYYTTACAHDYTPVISQAAVCKYMNAVTFEDWFASNHAETEELIELISEDASKITKIHLPGGDISISGEDFHLLDKSMRRMRFIHQSRISTRKADRARKGIRDTAYVSLHDELVAMGAKKNTTPEEVKAMIAFYREHGKKRETEHKELLNKITQDLKKKNPEFKLKSGERYWMLQDMSTLNKDADYSALYMALYDNKYKKDAESKKQRAAAIEEVFKTIMSFDINRISFSSYMDIISQKKNDPARFDECRAVTALASEAVALLQPYGKLIEDENIGCKLNAAHVAEVRARCDLLMSADALFDDRFLTVLESPLLSGDNPVILDDAMHLTSEELDAKAKECKAKDDEEGKRFWESIHVLVDVMEGFDTGVPLKLLEDHFRTLAGITRPSRATEVLNILNGTESVLKDIEITETKIRVFNETKYLAQFAYDFNEKNLTVSEREAKLFNKNSRLYNKRLIADKLTEKSKGVQGELYAVRKNISLDNRMAVGEERLADLSAFMKGKEDTDNSMVERYADKNQRMEFIDTLTREIMETSIDLKITTDEQFALNADKMEKISRKAKAYDRLLKANPEYLDRLRNRRPGSKQNDLDLVTGRLNCMLAISDYYRARKALITDTYYILHNREEMSADRDKASNEDQRRVADLIRLVGQCVKYLAGEDYRSREESGIERVLEQVERRAAQNAFLTGRPDLKKVDPAKTHKTNKEITRYLEKAGLNMSMSNEMAKWDEDMAVEGAEDYYTDSVRDYFKLFNTYNRIRVHDKEALKKLLSPKKYELYNKLNELAKDKNGNYIGRPDFNDPVTGEVWKIGSDLSRLSNCMVMMYAGDLSDEELCDIYEGLTLTYRNDMDLKNNEQLRQYARTRWLNSMQKLFRLERDHVKRFESTYGTLVDELPIGCFMQCMGPHGYEYATRNLFTQDMAEIVDVGCSDCVVDGENITSAELLKRHGLITQEEIDECAVLDPGYYQNAISAQTSYYFSFNTFLTGEAKSGYYFSPQDMNQHQYTKDHKNIRGPKLSRAESRRIWKETLKNKTDDNLTGGAKMLGFQMTKLDLYTPAQKKDIRKVRAKDAGIVRFYDAYLDDREEILLASTRKAIGAGVDEDLLKKLIVFHPGMLTGVGLDGNGVANIPGTEEFYDRVKRFAGVGITEENKLTAKKSAFEELIGAWTESFDKAEISTTEELMNPDTRLKQGRNAPDEIVEKSKLLKTEVRHRMNIVLQDLVKAPDAHLWYTEDTQKSFRSDMKRGLRAEIVRAIILSKFYQELGDIGSQHKTYPERMYQILYKIIKQNESQYMDLDRDILDAEAIEALKYFGIRMDGPIGAPKPEAPADNQAEAEAEPAAVEFDEKLFAEELDEDAIFADEAEAQQQAQQQDDPLYEQEPIPYQANIVAKDKGTHVQYEKQTGLYCWACVMSGLMNSYAGKKVSDLNTIKNYKPQIPRFEESGIKKREDYNRGVSMVGEMIAGEKTGNPQIFGDYIFEKLPEFKTAVRSAFIAREEGRLDYCKRRFLETISKSLEKGPVGMLLGGHFVLVRELQGDKLKVNDSLSNTPDKLTDYGQTVSQLFSSADSQIELVWLENMEGHEAELARQFDLNYNAETGEFSQKYDGEKKANAPGEAGYKQVRNAETILHNNGIEAMTQLFEDVVFDSVYLPKALNGNHPGPNGGQPAPEQPAEEHKEQHKEERKKQAKEKEEPKNEIITEKKADKRKKRSKNITSNELSDDRKASPEQIKKLFGEDTLAVQMDKNAAVLNQIVQKNKNADADKLKLLERMADEMSTLAERRRDDLELVADYTGKKEVNDLIKLFKTKEEKEVLRLWSFTQNEKGANSYISNVNGYVGEHSTAKFGTVLSSMMKVSVDDFIDTDESKFISGFAKKYEIICQMAAGEFILRKYEEGEGDSGFNHPIAELQGKIAFFRELKEQYEDRIRVLSSPYYLILKEADKKAYLGKGAESKIEKIKDAKQKEFARLYRKTMTSPLAMGKDIRSRYNVVIKENKKLRSLKDVEKAGNIKKEISELSKRIKNPQMMFPELETPIYEKQEDEAEGMSKLRDIYRGKKQNALKGYPKKDEDFVKVCPAHTRGVLINDQDKKDIARIESIFLDSIVRDGQIEGKPIAKEHLSEIREAVSRYFQLRREFSAVTEAEDLASKLAVGMGCDMKNEVFTKTDVGKKMLQFRSEDGIPNELTEFGQQIELEYSRAMIGVFELLHSYGYMFSSKYEKRITSKEAEALEHNRKVKEKDINIKLAPGAEPTPWNYPSVTVNGQKFTLYTESENAFIKSLTDKEYITTEADRETIMKKMGDYCDLIKKNTVIADLFRGDGGEKSMVYTVYHKDLMTKKSSLEKELKKALSKSVK